MSEALHVDSIEFDDAPRPTDNAGEATSRIRSACDAAGLNVPAGLYNEALELAREGHLGQAHARLTMLLCLDPDDADALLLMAKVQAAQGKPSEALAKLEASIDAGAFPPAGFREQLESAIRAERARDEEARARVASREQGETRQLRAEARELRSENSRLELELGDAAYREKTWKYLAIGLGALVVLVVALFSFAGRTDAPAAVAEAPPTLAPAVDEPVVEPAAPVGKAAGKSAEKSAAQDASKPVAKDAAKAAPAVDPAPGKGPRVHVVGANDTLYKLSKRYYGDASKWEKIRDANKGTLKNGKDLSLGMKLVIP